MKEAYLKQKLTELSEEAEEIKQYIKMQRNQLDQIEAQIRDYKTLVKRLDDLDLFKQDSLKELKQNNKDQLDQIAEELQQRNEKQLNKRLDDKSMLLNETKELLKQDQRLFQQYTQIVREAEMATVFLKEFHHLLLLKLVNKAVFSQRDLSEIKRRAEKRSLDKVHDVGDE